MNTVATDILVLKHQAISFQSWPNDYYTAPISYKKRLLLQQTTLQKKSYFEN